MACAYKVYRWPLGSGDIRCNIQNYLRKWLATWLKPKEDELWMSNGRINEIWQSGFDDVERRPYISQRWPENFVEIHPDDAKQRHIESGDYVMMYSDRVASHKDTILGIHNDHFQFSELMKRGHIELSKAAVTAVAIVTPPTSKKASCIATC